jgi:hypothetical protein
VRCLHATVENLLEESHFKPAIANYICSMTSRVTSKTGILAVSISDLRDREFSDAGLSADEQLALSRFDAYRIGYLNDSETEEIFHKRYQELQAKAMLSPWQEFLKNEYDRED